MEFRVTRTSSYGDPPNVEEAVEKQIPAYDTRSCSEEEFNKSGLGGAKKWRDIGTEHTILENGYIRRRLPDDKIVWVIQINSLEELMTFIDKYGRCVVSNRDAPSIEVYDDYRE